jgi:hypothetical protein
VVANFGQDTPQWRRSSHSGGGNDCVEIAPVGVGTAVRDSKNPNDAQLRFDTARWAAFLDRTRSAVVD